MKNKNQPSYNVILKSHLSFQFLLNEDIDFTSEYYLKYNSGRSQVIYIVVVISLIAFLISLPYIFVDVSVKSTGMLKAATEITALRATASGYVKEVLIKENETVEKGELLLAIESPMLLEKEHYLNSKLAEIDLFIDDAKKLSNDLEKPSITTSLYRQAFADYRQKLAERQTAYLKAKQDYNRNKKLFDVQVIAAVEFENFKFELDRTEGNIDLLKQSFLSTWQQELRNYEKESIDYRNQLAQVSHEIEELNIKAPVSGTIQNLIGLYPGSPLFANQDVAQISPITNLIAEIFISPSDIGLLHEGMEVRMQVNAFNYNQWGLLQGKVQEISSDIYLVNSQPVFKVKCLPTKEYLSLKNGYQGKLKKGMTLQARFIVANRSLWQLLYDKVDNWVNPNIKNSLSLE